MRLLGAVSAGWMADRLGRCTPLMISIAWYSVCQFIAGFSPSFTFLLVMRTLLGIGMGAEWPAGASLAMESWPERSRGLMSGILQGSWNLGFLIASVAYGVLFDHIGWRGLFWLGILSALVIVYIRFFVKEPPVWVENRRRQKEEQREVRAAASAFCYHIGAIFGGAVPPLITLLAGYHHMGLAMAMLAGIVVGAISYCLALLAGPETKGTRFKADLTVA
jgi:MFS family permease